MSTRVANNKRHRVRQLLDEVNAQLWSRNVQAISNNEYSTYEPTVVFENGLPVQYSCYIEENSEVSNTTVAFDYEASIPFDAEVEQNLRLLQWSLLDAAAQFTGLKKRCDFRKQFEDENGNPQSASLPYPTFIYAISSTPQSEVYDGECAILEYDAELSKCLPIKAELIVHYRGPSADDDLVNDYVQGLFEETLLENPDKLLVGYVEKISYVGNRSALFQIESGTVPSNSNDTFGAIISAATFFTIGSIFFLLRWKQRQTKHSAKGAKGPDELQEVDLETPRTQCSDSSFNDVSSPNMPEMFDTVLVERISSTPVSLSQQDDDQAIHRVSPITSTDAVVPPILTSLPPRPPMRSTTRRSSQVLKKRRRRKKKKKKPIGKRGNSRDCIQPMECIPEDEEEGSDSEHTWTDDDGSSNQSWAGSFPDSSPKLSPQNEFFSSEGFSTDIDFIIEAPDFPFDKHAEKTKQFRPNQNRIKPRPKDFVSHIKEESAESIRASISGGESHNSVRLLI